MATINEIGKLYALNDTGIQAKKSEDKDKNPQMIKEPTKVGNENKDSAKILYTQQYSPEMSKDALQKVEGNKSPDQAAKPASESKALQSGGESAETKHNRTEFKAQDKSQVTTTNPEALVGKKSLEDGFENRKNPGLASEVLNPGKPANADQLANAQYAKRSKKDRDKRDRRRASQYMMKPKQESPLDKIIEGAQVSESQTQDIFIPSGIEAKKRLRQRDIVEEIRDYEPSNIAHESYSVVIVNADEKAENGVGANMQKQLFAKLFELMSDEPEIFSPEFRYLVREVIQGTVHAAEKSGVGMKELVKMLLNGFMVIAPHENDEDAMAEVLALVVSELIYGKLNSSYTLKSMSNNIGAAFFTLSMYYQNYQTDIEYTRELDAIFTKVCRDAIFNSTGQITNFSQNQAKFNLQEFVKGRVEEDRLYQKSLVKEMMFSPFKKVTEKVGNTSFGNTSIGNTLVQGLMNKIDKM